MKLIPVNKDSELLQELDVGYTDILEYNDPRFHGHQKGVAICIINKETGAVEKNMLNGAPEDKKDEYLKEILESKQVIKVVDDIHQYENDKLIPKQIFFLPYIVADHPVFKQTVNNMNISGAINVHYEVDVELLFVHNNLNRYILIHFTTQNVSIMDCVHGLFDEDDTLREEMANNGIAYIEEENEDGEWGYGVDYYDEAGNREVFYYSGDWAGERLRDDLVSMRVINMKEIIDD